MPYYSLTVLYYLATYMMGSFTILPRGFRMHFETDPCKRNYHHLAKSQSQGCSQMEFSFPQTTLTGLLITCLKT